MQGIFLYYEFPKLNPKKNRVTSRLDGIPGVGDVRKKALLKHFKSVRAIAQAELLQLEAVLPKAAARAVYDHFHKEETP